jgi:hypothetical protein
MLLALLQPLAAYAGNDYPTLDRVNYVLDCMDRHGEQSIVNLTSCSCTLDGIANKMKYEQFSDANTFAEFSDTPAKKGEAFRTNKKAKATYNKLKELETEAETHCFVKHIVQKPKAEAAAEENKSAP